MATMTGNATHPVVSQAEWLEARKALLVKEKEHTRLKDQLTQLRMSLPWVKVEKEYVFERPDGKKSLADLFDGRSQLMVYHFMLASGWENGCSGCSFVADHFGGPCLHLPHHDVSMTMVSIAPIDEIERFRTRMGWEIDWVSSAETDFNYDYSASFHQEDLDRGPVLYNFTEQKLSGDEQPGLSFFYRDEDGTTYHTYSTYERGLDVLLTTYDLLDMSPKGRNETGAMSWVKRHDEYEVK